MRKLGLFILFVLLLAPMAVVQAQDGVTLQCPDGRTIENGVEVIVNIRAGFTYTATAIGIDGFDPVMAVYSNDRVQDCADDSERAEDYTANLPTTGFVPSSSSSAQLPYANGVGGFQDVSIIVADLNGGGGEFVLIMEGMAVTSADGTGTMAGDPFYFVVNENVAEASIDMTAYMIGIDNSVDPYLSIVNTNTEEAILICDDGGTCEGGESLAGSSVSRSNGRIVDGDSLDSMLAVPTTELADAELPITLPLRMTSYRQNTNGEYIVAFHIGVAGSGGTSSSSSSSSNSGNSNNDDGNTTSGTVDPDTGVNISCPNGPEIIGGVEVVVNIRPGFTYTATAIGIDGFDPVIAVVVQDEVQNCNDDSSDAGEYTANLPTTGSISSSNLNAQINYNNPFNGLENVSIIVGGYRGQTGEFLLVLEGMAATNADGSGVAAGDPFWVNVTPNMVSSGVDLSLYMIGVDNSIDPYMSLFDYDESEQLITCDDAGTSLCQEDTTSLSGFSVSRTNGREANGDNLDSMLLLATTTLTDIEAGDNLFLPFLMTTYQQNTTGEYLVAFHIGIGSGEDVGGSDL